MSSFTLPIDVMLFELRRSLTWGRIFIWLILVAFPVAIMVTMSSMAKSSMGANFNATAFFEVFGVTLYFLVPEVTCLLGLLLWATPAISTEIEGQTWIYLAMRASGRRSVLVGKYLTAVFWTVSAAIAAITLSVFSTGSAEAFRMWWVLSLLAVMSCLAHAALYVLIGAVFYRRTMVAAVLYTVVVEFGLSFIPALVNKFTINYRLRGLLANWMDWDRARSQAESIFGSEPTQNHLLALLAITIVFLCLAVRKVERTEYPTQQEG